MGLQSKARHKISSSNPQLNAASDDSGLMQPGHGISSKRTSNDDDDDEAEEEEDQQSDLMNVPGNRNSLAETRAGSLNVSGHGLSSSSRKVRKSLPFYIPYSWPNIFVATVAIANVAIMASPVLS